MKKENRWLIKAVSLILSASLFVCAFASCTKKEQEEEITRGTAPITPPTGYAEPSEYHGEPTTDPAATKSQTTVTAKAASTASHAATTSAQSIILPDEKANEAVEEAAQKGGTSAADIAQFVAIMGYDYDPKQGIFYTSLDNWQRQGNFVAHYDTAAHYINMNYKTIRIDFGPCEGLNWRMQLWKGEYGVFGGCEAGIYTSDPDKNKMLYTATDNDHMLQWESALYLSRSDFKNSNPWFYREWQTHWWLTGFKSGVVNPEEIVMYLHVRMRSAQMANEFEQALLTSGYKKASMGPAPSRRQVEEKMDVDTFCRSLNDFYIVWEDLGELNYVQRTG